MKAELKLKRALGRLQQKAPCPLASSRLEVLRLDGHLLTPPRPPVERDRIPPRPRVPRHCSADAAIVLGHRHQPADGHPTIKQSAWTRRHRVQRVDRAARRDGALRCVPLRHRDADRHRGERAGAAGRMRWPAGVSPRTLGQRAGKATNIGLASVVGKNRPVKIERQRLVPGKQWAGGRGRLSALDAGGCDRPGGSEMGPGAGARWGCRCRTRAAGWSRVSVELLGVGRVRCLGLRGGKGGGGHPLRWGMACLSFQIRGWERGGRR